METQHTKHATYKLAYHFVWCPNYRKRILVGPVATFLEQEIRCLGKVHGWTLGMVNVQPDHVHLFLGAPPAVAPSQIAPNLEGNHSPPSLSTVSSIETALVGRRTLVSLGLCWQRWRYERGCGSEIHRIGTGLV